MNRILAVALVTGMAFVPVSAFALDRATGVVEKVDTTDYSFTIKLDGASKRQMSFRVSEDKFEELELDVNDRLEVEYDGSECRGAADCVPTAAKVDRKG